jgi:hypothetical protein
VKTDRELVLDVIEAVGGDRAFWERFFGTDHAILQRAEAVLRQAWAERLAAERARLAT